MSSAVQIPQKVLPGQPILPIYTASEGSEATKYVAGSNVRMESIQFNESWIPALVSSVLGRVEISDGNETNTKVVSVVSKNAPEFNNSGDAEDSVQSRKYKAVTPDVGDIVLARVTRMTNSRVNAEILSVSRDTYVESETERVESKSDFDTSKYNQRAIHLTNLLPTENGEFFKATIRSQDIRSAERDSVKTWECFQPGDIVRASVISLGDGVSYYLTTARNDLGVVFAKSADGELLYPLDWESMIAPSTGVVEDRKCARPF